MGCFSQISIADFSDAEEKPKARQPGEETLAKGTGESISSNQK